MSRTKNRRAAGKKLNLHASKFDYPAQLLLFRRRIVLKALARCRYNKSKTARLLKVSRPYLYQLMNQARIKNLKSPDRRW